MDCPSESAGMSNERHVKNVSINEAQGFLGKANPPRVDGNKAKKPEGVVDAQQVEFLSSKGVITNGVTERVARRGSGRPSDGT